MKRIKENELKAIMIKFNISREVASEIMEVGKDTVSFYKTIGYRKKVSKESFMKKIRLLMEGYLNYLEHLAEEVKEYLEDDKRV